MIKVLKKKKKIYKDEAKTIIHLKKIMNTRVFKILKGHVIASVYVLIRNSVLKAFPGQIFIFNNV